MGAFGSFLISVAFKWCRHIVRAVIFPNLQMIKLPQLMRDKLHVEADACTREERGSFQLHPPIRRFPASSPAWWLLQDLMVGRWPAGPGTAGTWYAAVCNGQYGAAFKARAVAPTQEMFLPSLWGQWLLEL